MYAKPYDRKFGIEFEFNIPGIEPELPDNNRLNQYPSKFFAVENLLNRNNLKGFSVHGDGSEYEVKTPILSGPNGFKTVKRFLDLMLSVGGRVDLRYDGLHVHHDAPEFINNKPLVVRLVENWLENQDEILKLAHNRRTGAGACPLWSESILNEFKRGTSEGYYGRRNLNIQSLIRHGTIEIRLHEGTLDYEQVFSWVRFGQAFIGKIVNESEDIIRAVNPDDLLQKFSVSRNASRFITKKMQTVYGTV